MTALKALEFAEQAWLLDEKSDIPIITSAIEIIDIAVEALAKHPHGKTAANIYYTANPNEEIVDTNVKNWIGDCRIVGPEVLITEAGLKVVNDLIQREFKVEVYADRLFVKWRPRKWELGTED